MESRHNTPSQKLYETVRFIICNFIYCYARVKNTIFFTIQFRKLKSDHLLSNYPHSGRTFPGRILYAYFQTLLSFFFFWIFFFTPLIYRVITNDQTYFDQIT